jgi:hypothetical protein
MFSMVVKPSKNKIQNILLGRWVVENDFKKITKTNIVEIYNEVTIDSEKFENLIYSIKRL